jgi:hypothetical protein
MSTVLGACDDALPRQDLGFWSYHQVVKFSKPDLATRRDSTVS